MKALFDKLRMSQWLVLAAVLAFAVFVIAPEQLQVGVWKLLLITAAAYVGYWLDRLLFPYARPHQYIEAAVNYRLKATDTDPIVFDTLVTSTTYIAATSLLRRAIVIAAVVIGVAIGV